MKFRPLSVDYHSRAQEIVAAERDIHARRMAPRSLPNPSPPCDRRRRRRRRCQNSQSEDGIGPGGRGDVPLDGDEETVKSISSADDDDIDDRGQAIGQVVERLRENCVDSLGPTRRLDADANERILWCMGMLGPAVHHSECAFRSIAPVTKGPVRGNTIPIAEQLLKPLVEITNSYSDLIETKFNAVIASLETGRSRFDSPSGHVFGFSVGDSTNNGLGQRAPGSDFSYEMPNRATFADTMHIAYRNSGCHDVGDSCLNLDSEKENALNSQIWTQHVNDMPMAKSIYLRHEPDDLAKIYRLKSTRSLANTRFASETIRSFRPQLSTTRSDSYRMIRAWGSCADNSDKTSSKPSFDATMYGISKSRKKVDCHSRSYSVPVAKFLDAEHDDTGMEQINDCAKYNDTAQTDVLVLFDCKRRHTISLDPDFDPLHQLPAKHERKIFERMPLNEMCSASSISTLLQLPGRFEESHELSFRPPKTISHLEFFSTTLKSCKEPATKDDSLESLLAVFETRAVMSCMKVQPQKIRFDIDIKTPMLLSADIETPVLLGADFRLPMLLDNFIKRPMSFGKGNKESKNNTKKSIMASNLKLPSFYEMFPSARKMINSTGGQRGGVNQKRFDESSYRVSKMVALKNLVNSSKVTCLFLPQCIVENSAEACAGSETHRSTRQEPMPTAISSAIRSCVRYDHSIEQGNIEFLQKQCSIYPVAPWFESDSAGDSASTKLSELDATIINMKRKTFCDDARAKSNDEGFRCLLLTGCSSKRNATSIYSYRGFLTNQVVDPHVFHRRYNAMVQVGKYHKRKRNPTTLVGRSHSLGHEAFFTPLALRVHVEAFARHKKSNSKGRNAPYSIKIKTSRHGQGQLTASKSTEKSLNKGATGLIIDMEHIDELATCLTNRSAQAAETNLDDSDGWRVVEALGNNSLKTRGELLHLLTKARELEDEKKSYLADLAVVNRPFVGTGNTETEVGVDTLNISPHLTGTIELTGPDDHHRVEKRKTGPDPSIDEHNEKKSKKKRKKDKKKKEKKKRNKHRKRKHRDAAPQQVSKKCKASETVESQILSAASSSSKHVRVVVPSIPLGMTPIIPAKKLEPIRKPPVVEQSESQNEHLSEPAFNDIIYSPAAVETSPDSVATLNSGEFATRPRNSEGSPAKQYYVKPPRKEKKQQIAASIESQVQSEALLDSETWHDLSLHVELLRGSDTEAHCNHGVNQSRNFENTHSGIDHGESYENESAFSNNSLNVPSQVRSPRNLLTSENFLEAFGQIVAELANGRWRNALSGSEKSGFDDTTISVIDCPLLDVVGVDIELSDESSVIVQYLSSWSENGGNASSVQQGARAFIRRLVLLAASGRYNAIHVILCLDVEMSSALTGEIVTLQNAAIQQIGCPAERVTFEFVGPRTLSASIALRLTSAPPECGDLDFISDQSVQERARFLVTLVPTMTVHMALRCCLDDSGKANSLSDLFEMARSTSRDMFPYKMEGVLSKRASDQLWSALNVDISHAY